MKNCNFQSNLVNLRFEESAAKETISKMKRVEQHSIAWITKYVGQSIYIFLHYQGQSVSPSRKISIVILGFEGKGEKGKRRKGEKEKREKGKKGKNGKRKREKRE